MQHIFPMILTHRTDRSAQIVVANAEQLAEVPEDFLPPTTATTAIASAAIPGVNLSAELAELDERRKSLDEAVDEFTAHVQTETDKLAALRRQIDTDRAELNAHRAALDDERARWDAQKNSAQPPESGADTGHPAADAAADAAAPPADAGTPAVVDPDATAAPAAPAKRTRATKDGE